MEYKFHFRHSVGHRHVFIVILSPLEVERGVKPYPLLMEKLPNIFQPGYIQGLELVHVDVPEGIEDSWKSKK